MRQYVPIILIGLTLASCDCIQKVTGVVLDRQTMIPIDNVSLGKYEIEDTANYYSRRIYTDKNGLFEYHSTSEGFRKCPDLVLYFNKQGYKTSKMEFESFTTNDTVYLDRIQLNKDSSIKISANEFDNQIDECILLLQNNQLMDISNEQHVKIMRCLNTILIRQFNGGRYDKLKKVSEDKNYTRDIIKVFTEWIPNRGMGYYFPKLQIELYGTPKLYAVYNVTK